MPLLWNTCEYCGRDVWSEPDPAAFFHSMTLHWQSCPGVPSLDQLELWECNAAKIRKIINQATGRANSYKQSRTDKEEEYRRIQKRWEEKLKRVTEGWV